MAELSEGIRARIGQLVESQQKGNWRKFAIGAGLTPSTLQGIKDRGVIPGGETLLRIARFAGVSVDWLLTGEGPREESRGVDPEAFAEIPLAQARPSAGNGTLLNEGDDALVKTFSFRRDWLKELGPVDRLVLVQVSGDSMIPTLADGDLVMVHTGRRDVRTGRLFVLRLGDELVVKRLQSLPGGAVSVISDNREVYPPFQAQVSEIKVIGEVLWRAGRV